MKIIRKIIVVSAIIIAAALTAAICFLFWQKQNYAVVAPQSQKPVIQEKNYVRLLFAGDIMFDRGIRYYALQNGGNKFIFDKISPVLLENDLVIANLEGPITNNKSVSLGTVAGSTNNYFFTFNPSWAKTLFDENIRIVDLGNNHILNFGQKGFLSTEKYLDDSKIGYFGSPNGPKSVSTEINGVKITFVSYNEFSILGGSEQQATIEEIKKAREYSDIVIIFSHWGVEYSKAPTNLMKNLAHSFIDAGADLIVGSHPHVIEPMELYNNKRIYYSLGNFVFDQYFSEDVRNSLGVTVNIDKITKKLKFSEVNFYLQNNGQTIIR